MIQNTIYSQCSGNSTQIVQMGLDSTCYTAMLHDFLELYHAQNNTIFELHGRILELTARLHTAEQELANYK